MPSQQEILRCQSSPRLANAPHGLLHGNSPRLAPDRGSPVLSSSFQRGSARGGGGSGESSGVLVGGLASSVQQQGMFLNGRGGGGGGGGPSGSGGGPDIGGGGGGGGRAASSSGRRPSSSGAAGSDQQQQQQQYREVASAAEQHRMPPGGGGRAAGGRQLPQQPRGTGPAAAAAAGRRGGGSGEATGPGVRGGGNGGGGGGGDEDVSADAVHHVLRLGWRPLVNVVCNTLTGRFLGGHDKELYILATGPGYGDTPLLDAKDGGCIMTCAQFERRAGRELSKKWKESIHVVSESDGSKCTLINWLRRQANRQYGDRVVGRTCWIRWCSDGEFYSATILGFNVDTGKHKVRYSESLYVEELHLPVEQVAFSATKPPYSELSREEVLQLVRPGHRLALGHNSNNIATRAAAATAAAASGVGAGAGLGRAGDPGRWGEPQHQQQLQLGLQLGQGSGSSPQQGQNQQQQQGQEQQGVDGMSGLDLLACAAGEGHGGGGGGAPLLVGLAGDPRVGGGGGSGVSGDDGGGGGDVNSNDRGGGGGAMGPPRGSLAVGSAGAMSADAGAGTVVGASGVLLVGAGGREGGLEASSIGGPMAVQGTAEEAEAAAGGARQAQGQQQHCSKELQDQERQQQQRPEGATPPPAAEAEEPRVQVKVEQEEERQQHQQQHQQHAPPAAAAGVAAGDAAEVAAATTVMHMEEDAKEVPGTCQRGGKRSAAAGADDGRDMVEEDRGSGRVTSGDEGQEEEEGEQGEGVTGLKRRRLLLLAVGPPPQKQLRCDWGGRLQPFEDTGGLDAAIGLLQQQQPVGLYPSILGAKGGAGLGGFGPVANGTGTAGHGGVGFTAAEEGAKAEAALGLEVGVAHGSAPTRRNSSLQQPRVNSAADEPSAAWLAAAGMGGGGSCDGMGVGVGTDMDVDVDGASGVELLLANGAPGVAGAAVARPLLTAAALRLLAGAGGGGGGVGVDGMAGELPVAALGPILGKRRRGGHELVDAETEAAGDEEEHMMLGRQRVHGKAGRAFGHVSIAAGGGVEAAMAEAVAAAEARVVRHILTEVAPRGGGEGLLRPADVPPHLELPQPPRGDERGPAPAAERTRSAQRQQQQQEHGKEVQAGCGVARTTRGGELPTPEAMVDWMLGVAHTLAPLLSHHAARLASPLLPPAVDPAARFTGLLATAAASSNLLQLRILFTSLRNSYSRHVGNRAAQVIACTECVAGVVYQSAFGVLLTPPQSQLPEPVPPPQQQQEQQQQQQQLLLPPEPLPPHVPDPRPAPRREQEQQELQQQREEAQQGEQEEHEEDRKAATSLGALRQQAQEQEMQQQPGQQQQQTPAGCVDLAPAGAGT